MYLVSAFLEKPLKLCFVMAVPVPDVAGGTYRICPELPVTAQEMTERRPRARLVEIAEAGHATALTSDEQKDLVRAWLDGVPAQG